LTKLVNFLRPFKREAFAITIVPESQIPGLVSAANCIIAVEQAFASMPRKSARNFPVVRETIGYADALYGFKSGFDFERAGCLIA
jgi:hypothetical protein